MTKLLWRDLMACSLVIFAGCARSSVGDLDDLGPEQSGATDGNDGRSANDEGRDTGAPLAPPTRAGEDPAETPPMAATSPTRDASVLRDAAATSSAEGSLDSGAPKLDGASAKLDTGPPPPVTQPAPLPDSGAIMSAADAGPQVSPPSNRCSRNSECNNVCIAVGIISCCRDDGRCGCSWAPGAYCL